MLQNPYLKKLNIAKLYIKDNLQDSHSSNHVEIAENTEPYGFIPDQQKDLLVLIHQNAYASTPNIYQPTSSINNASIIPQYIPYFRNDIHDFWILDIGVIDRMCHSKQF